MSRQVLLRNAWLGTSAIGVVLGTVMSCGLATADDDRDHGVKTKTPIKHLIVLIGENWTFDSVYATYKPKHGQTVANLLSSGIMIIVRQARAERSAFPPIPDKSAVSVEVFHRCDGDRRQDAPTSNRRPRRASQIAEHRLCADSRRAVSNQGQAPFDRNSRPGCAAADDRALPRSARSRAVADGRLGAADVHDRHPRRPTRRASATAFSRSPARRSDTTATAATWCIGCTTCGSNRTAMSSMRRPHNPSGCSNDLYPFVGVARNDGSGQQCDGLLEHAKR